MEFVVKFGSKLSVLNTEEGSQMETTDVSETLETCNTVYKYEG